MEINEKKLIKHCQAGNLEEFSQLYDAYFTRIYDFIYYRVMQEEAAEDLVSLTFLKALENIGTFNSARGSFSSWIYRIARNNIIDHHRKQKDEIHLEAACNISSPGDMKTDSENRILLDEVMKYLDRLKPEQKEIIIMRLWEGRTHQEIADTLGITVAKCKMTFSRSIGKLRSDLSMLIASLLMSLF